MKHNFKFHFVPFIISFIVGVIYVFISTTGNENIIKVPTPFSNDLYTDYDGECYTVKVEETECIGDEKKFDFTFDS